MLHILWLILKWILILLGSLLGIVVLLLFLVLFVPVRYNVCGQKEGEEIRGRVRVSWLLRVISYSVCYEEKKVVWDIRIFGISLLKVKRRKSFRKEAKKKTQTKKERGSKAAALPEKSLAEEKNAALPEKSLAEEKNAALPEKSVTEETAALPEKTMAESEPAREEEKKDFSVYFDRVRQMLTAVPAKVGGFFKKLWEGFGKILSGVIGLFWKFLQLPVNILRRLEKITLTIHNFCDKINYWKDFLNEEPVRNALRFVWDECKRLLKHLLPTKLTGQVRFGMEDPSVTGEILAGLGMTYPIHKNRIQVIPVFDEQVLEGNLQCRGRISLGILVLVAAKLYFNKNIKYVWKRLKHKEG